MKNNITNFKLHGENNSKDFFRGEILIDKKPYFVSCECLEEIKYFLRLDGQASNFKPEKKKELDNQILDMYNTTIHSMIQESTFNPLEYYDPRIIEKVVLIKNYLESMLINQQKRGSGLASYTTFTINEINDIIKTDVDNLLQKCVDKIQDVGLYDVVLNRAKMFYNNNPEDFDSLEIIKILQSHEVSH